MGRVSRRIKQLYEESDLTFSETSVLTRLAHGGEMTPSQLAALEHVRPQAMGNTLTALEERKLIKRRPDPADGRKVQISIAAAGRALLAAKSEEINELLRRAVADGFSSDELRKLAAAVPLLERLADRL